MDQSSKQAEVFEVLPVFVHLEDGETYAGQIVIAVDGTFALTYIRNDITFGLKKPETIKRALKGDLTNRQGESISVSMSVAVALRLVERGVVRKEEL